MKKSILSLLCCLIFIGNSKAQQTYCTPPVHSPNYTGITLVKFSTAPEINRTSTIADLYYHEKASAPAVNAGSSYTT